MTVEVSVSPTRIQFAFERAVLVSRLIDGTFPDYERVIPTGNEKMAIFRADELGRAVDRVATISTEKARAVKLGFDTSRFDQYGRTLAGVTSAQGLLVNAELARLGLGLPVVVGNNRKYEPPVTKASAEAQQAERLERLRADRDGDEVARRLDELRTAARGTDNVLPPMREALRARATGGEVADALREVWGRYVPRETF